MAATEAASRTSDGEKTQKPKRSARPTNYQLLRKDASGLWEEVGVVEAISQTAARASYTNSREGEHTLAAVPESSWKPTTRKAETFTKYVETPA